MRILLLDANVTYLNPTRSLLPDVLAIVGNLTPFGPGWVSESVLRAGVRNFVARQGPFDVAVVTEHVHRSLAPSWNESAAVHAYRKKYSFPGNWSAIASLPSIAAELDELHLPVVSTFFETDGYSLPEGALDFALRVSSGFVGPGPDLSWVPAVDWDGESRLECAPTATWNTFLEETAGVFCSLPHFVSRDEVSWVPYRERRRRVLVPGIQYREREDARRLLRQAQLPFASVGTTLPGLAARVNPLLPNGLRVKVQRHLQERFRREIAGSWVAFTSGSVLRHCVRKYFEIPAAGTLLLATPCQGVTNLGFRSEINYWSADMNSLEQDVSRLLSNPSRLEEVAKAGQLLVRERHSVSARAKQIAGYLEAMLAGRKVSGRFVAGDFVIG